MEFCNFLLVTPLIPPRFKSKQKFTLLHTGFFLQFVFLSAAVAALLTLIPFSLAWDKLHDQFGGSGRLLRFDRKGAQPSLTGGGPMARQVLCQ